MSGEHGRSHHLRRHPGLPDPDADDLFVAVQGACTVARALNGPDLFRQSVERLRVSAPQFGEATA